MIILPFIAGLLWGALSCSLVIFFSLFTIRTRLDQLVRKKTLKHVEFKAVAEEAANLPPVKVETLCKVVQFDDDIVGDSVQCRVVLFSNTVYVYRVDKLITLPDHREEVVEEHLLGKINASCVVATGERISKYHRHRNKTKRYAAVKGKCTILAARPNLPLFMEDPAEKLRRYIVQSKREQLEQQRTRARRLLSLSLPSETSYTVTSRVGSVGCVEELHHPSLLIANNTPSRTNSSRHEDESTHKVKSNGIDYSNGLNRSFRSTPRQREESSQSVLVKATTATNNNNNKKISKINASSNKIEKTPQYETNCSSNINNIKSMASPNPASTEPLHSSLPFDTHNNNNNNNNNNSSNNYLHKECQNDRSSSSNTLSKHPGRAKHKRYGERSSDSASNEGSSSSEEFTCRNDAALSETPIAQWRRMAIKFPTRRVQERWLNFLQGTAQTVQWSDYLHHLPQLDVFNLITARLFYENTRTNGLNDLLTRKFQEKLTRTSKSLPSTLKGTISLESLAIGGEVPLFTHVSEGVVSPLGELDFEFDVLYRGGLKLSIRFAIAYRGIRLPDIIFHITVLELAGRVFFNVGPPPTHKFWLSVPRAPQLRMSFTQEIASREGILNAIVSGIPDLSKVMTNVVKDLLFEDMICPKWDDFPWPVVERTKTDTIKVERRGAPVYTAEEKEKPCTAQGKPDHLVCDHNKHTYHHKVPCTRTSNTVKGNIKTEHRRYTSPGTYEMNRSYYSQESSSLHSSGYSEPINYNVPCGSPNYNMYNNRPYSPSTMSSSSSPSLTSSYYISSSEESLSSWSNSSLSSSLSSSSSSSLSYSSSADSASHSHNYERRSNKADVIISSSSYSSPVTPVPATTTTTTTTTRTGVVNTTDGPLRIIDTTITTNAANDTINGDKRKVLSHRATSSSKKEQNKEDKSGVIVTSSPAEVLRERAITNKETSSSSSLQSHGSGGHSTKHSHREHVQANGSAIHVIDDQHLDTNTKHIINRKVAVRHAAIDDEEERDARKYELKMRDSNLDSSELSELVDSQNSVDDNSHRENSPHEKHLRDNHDSNNHPHTHHAITPTSGDINENLNSTMMDHHTRHLERDYAKTSIQPQITSYGEEHRMQHGNWEDTLHNTHTSTRARHNNNNNGGNSATRLNDELNESNSSNRNTMVINFLNGRDEHNNHSNSGPLTAHEEKEFKRESNKRHHHHDGGKSNKHLKDDDDDDELIHPAQGVTVRKGGAMDPNAPSKREKKMMEREKKIEEEYEEEEREYELQQAQEGEGEYHHHHHHHHHNNKHHHNNIHQNNDVYDVQLENHYVNNYNSNMNNSYCSTNDIYGDGDVNVVDMVPFSHTHPRKSSVGNKIKQFVSELEHSVERTHSFQSSGSGSVGSNRNSMSLFSAQSNVNNCSGTSTLSSKKGKKRGFFAKRISEIGSFIQNKKHKPVLNASSSNVFWSSGTNNNTPLMRSSMPTSRSDLALADVFCTNNNNTNVINYDNVSNIRTVTSTPCNLDNITNDVKENESITLWEGLSVHSETGVQRVNSSNNINTTNIK